MTVLRELLACYSEKILHKYILFILPYREQEMGVQTLVKHLTQRRKGDFARFRFGVSGKVWKPHTEAGSGVRSCLQWLLEPLPRPCRMLSAPFPRWDHWQEQTHPLTSFYKRLYSDAVIPTIVLLGFIQWCHRYFWNTVHYLTAAPS